MSEPLTADVIVIGSGSGGLTAAIGLARFGKKIALVERGVIGGDCTNTGCIPSKRLIHLAKAATSGALDPSTILSDVRTTRDGLTVREQRELEEDPNITLLWGHGRLAGPRTVVVSGPDGEQTVSAPHIVIATGSRARRIPIPGLPPDRYLTNESLFDIAAPPGHLAVIGAGAIGLEMATAFRRLGCRVTLIDLADRVLPTASPDASAVLHESAGALDIDVRLAVHVTDYEPTTRCLRLTGDGGDSSIADVDAVLVAIGRVPNTEDIGLDRAGVEVGPEGIAVNAWGRTSVKSVWAVGDVTPGSHTTHGANALGRRIIQRIALPWLPARGRPPIIPSAVFCDPEVAWVGLSDEERARRFHPQALREIRVEFPAQDRGLTDGVQRGFISVHAMRLSGRIVSATVVGPNASDLITPLTMAVDRKISLLRLSRLVYAYPTFAAIIGAAGDEFARATLPYLRREAAAFVRHRWRRGRPPPPA